MKYKILTTREFIEWFNRETFKSQAQIDKRLKNIELEGHFGIHRDDLGNGISELKWDNGRRIYYVHIPEKKILLLLGGNQCESILRTYQNNLTLNLHFS